MTNEEIKLLKNFITWQSLPFVDNLFTHEDEIIKKFDEWLRLKDEALELAIKAVEQEPKIGHWVEHEIKDTCRWLTCSVCGYEWINKKENFCPNCGARMAESQKSEEII